MGWEGREGGREEGEEGRGRWVFERGKIVLATRWERNEGKKHSLSVWV